MIKDFIYLFFTLLLRMIMKQYQNHKCMKHFNEQWIDTLLKTFQINYQNLAFECLFKEIKSQQKMVQTFEGRTHFVKRRYKFIRCSKVISYSNDKTIQIWDVSLGK
ncbi:hypothetical protein RFI_32632 [Reticulomyxa filosa]|uniref:Uncharacterized protein n=1 Tax=Reticulomyxa filosa TaxID=46433 RepID=X6LS94_RETFI|nr:hypothetical protein RFI_32632 [Reticulomyxa filosa]|eukprot:ETO04763.1 hypothetical protein RFI_32632 [Reticulomyxa filosa]